MGLLSIIRKNKERDRELRLLFLGLDNAGKTTTLKRLLCEPTDEISPTFGFTIRTLVRNRYAARLTQLYNQYLYALELTTGDVGGQRALRPYWRNYFEKTDGVVWVVDSCDVHRLDDGKTELWSLLDVDVRKTTDASASQARVF